MKYNFVAYCLKIQIKIRSVFIEHVGQVTYVFNDDGYCIPCICDSLTRSG